MATPKTVQSLAGGKWKIDDTGNLIKIGGVLVSDHVGAAIGVGAGGVEFITPLKGDAGPEGPQGETGADGAQGPRGYTGADGAPGTPGAKGDQGDQGIQGPPGGSGLTHPQVMARSWI